MKKFRTVVSVIIMVLAAVAGFLTGAALGGALEGAILFAMIAGFGCVIYGLDNRESWKLLRLRKKLLTNASWRGIMSKRRVWVRRLSEEMGEWWNW